MRRAIVGLVTAVAAVLLTPSVASADAAGPTDYRSEIVSVTPATDVVEFSIEGGDAFVHADVEPSHELIVLGYAPSYEPYLRIGPDGTVEQNARSYATYYNTDRFGRGDIPDQVDTEATPEWERVGDGGGWSWHDHRAHWMGDDPPIGMEPGDSLPDQSIAVLVDGVATDVVVRTTLQPSPSVVPAIVGVLLGLQLGLLAYALGPAIATFVLFVAGTAATVVGAAQYLSLSSASGPLVTWWLLPAIAVVAAVSIVMTYGRSRLVEVGLLAVGGVMLVLWGFRRRDGLDAAVLPTDLPFWFDRLVTAAATIVGLLVVAAAARTLYRLLAPPDELPAVASDA